MEKTKWHPCIMFNHDYIQQGDSDNNGIPVVWPACSDHLGTQQALEGATQPATQLTKIKDSTGDANIQNHSSYNLQRLLAMKLSRVVPGRVSLGLSQALVHLSHSDLCKAKLSHTRAHRQNKYIVPLHVSSFAHLGTDNLAPSTEFMHLIQAQSNIVQQVHRQSNSHHASCWYVMVARMD